MDLQIPPASPVPPFAQTVDTPYTVSIHPADPVLGGPVSFAPNKTYVLQLRTLLADTAGNTLGQGLQLSFRSGP